METDSNKIDNGQTLTSRTNPNSILCRICFESEPEKLISPCGCVGTAAYVHEPCLEMWILLKFPNPKAAFCEICKEKFAVNTKPQCKCKLNAQNKPSFKKNCIAYTVFCIFTLIISFALIAIYYSKNISKDIQSFALLVVCCTILILISFICFGKFIYSNCIIKKLKITRIKSAQVSPRQTSMHFFQDQ
ncbi:hypothetical protein SteCoe_33596 [Stentor coeruleus]|uniref:Uncharacterized protein n=1 Tax=Stentor coeruleus TaxID=5963 RepID=A0A1R2AWF1_9CILI|nr:hypothetical protein SteCoe_33596 [Stentor coeruleus]